MDYYDNNELMHFGTKGMKWGVRRSKETMANSVSKLSKKNEKLTSKMNSASRAADMYSIKSAKIQKGNAKYDTRLAKAEANKAKYDLKVNREMNRKSPNIKRVSEYQIRSKKYNDKILKVKKKLRYNKWEMRATDATADAIKAKTKIEKNKRMIDTFNKTITAMDSDKIKRGRVFMRYVTA